MIVANKKGKETVVKTTVTLPADLHWRFQEERARRRMNNEEAVRDALERWTQGTSTEGLTPAQSAYMRAFAAMLRADDPLLETIRIGLAPYLAAAADEQTHRPRKKGA